jgi:hypothetical protein
MKKSLLLFSSFLISASMIAQGFQWAKREGNQTEGRLISTDAAGNSYVYGGIYITTTVGTQTLDPLNGEDFIAKYDNAGTFQWVKQMDSLDVSDLAATSGGVFITGRFRTGAMIGSTSLAGTSGWDGFIASLDAAGNVSWVKTINNPNTYESANSIAVDNSGNLYVSGTYGGTTASIGTTTLTGPGFESMFMLKMTSGGNITWSKTASANAGGSVSSGEIEVAPSGDIYVMSSADGDTAHYDSFTYFAGSYPAELLLHYSNSGSILDMAEINHSYQDNVTSITVDGNGNVYTLQTNYLMSFSLNKFNASLDTVWMKTDGGGGHLSVRNVEVLQTGEILVIGEVDEDATFGTNWTVYDYGGGNGFLAYYNSAGTFMTLEEIPGSVFMGSGDIDGSNNVYLTGSFNDSASFDAIDLSSPGVSSMFLARYNTAVSGITSLTENAVSVYPNPCAEILTCDLRGFATSSRVRIFNALGEIVYDKQASPELLKIDLTDEKPGIYLMNLYTDGSVKTKKIIKN